MKFVIVTGMSGAGRSSVMRILEDDGYFCVDNLPVSLLPTFMQLTENSSEQIERVALGLDIRGGQSALKDASSVLNHLKEEGHALEILFLEASTPVIVKRYKETRRIHPLADGGRMDKAIEDERELLINLKKQADYIIDTSTMLIRELKQEIDRIFIEEENFCNFYLTFVSFGFKYGIPSDADLVFDVRFLPNPFYVESLKPQTGNDAEVYDYVMASEKAREFLVKMKEMLDFLIPNYIMEGKTQLVIAIGCTGGKHRSVTLTNAIHKEFENTEYGCKKEHRDIEKDRLRNICRSQEK
ncbi:MAG: RNase adapter RapZ [Lachnospiraceae bacterium]|nr:RNase adapter RapZ [Lachnospiraceae bacterium]